LHGEGFPISSRSKYEGKWGKMGFLDKGAKNFHSSNESDVLNMNDKQKLTCDDTEKGSKMTKKQGSKKGQKWPKMGVQKRVKKGPKIDFLELQKIMSIREKNI
jgi:hypothetical protein